MKIFPLFPKKGAKTDLTPEERMKAEEMEYAPEPDMRAKIETETEVSRSADGDVIETSAVVVPEKGVLRTDNLVKKYGKRTVANHVSINVTQG